ncbi:MMPL family transporter [Aeoliella mucimassa]|uniref:MMPL family transporter n=1 Tax=Aeoliella mucimassa TaxID=2527972 RepID=UPI0018D4C478|nr:MMPL family transporter [Aeoliella mucimassa]
MNRFWLVLLVGWIVLAIGLKMVAPSWKDVALDGDFDYLPENSTSRRGIELLKKAFPDENVKSQIALVFARPDRPLDKLDRQYAIDVANKLAHVDHNNTENLQALKNLIVEKFGSDPTNITPETLLVTLEQAEAAASDSGESAPPVPSLGLSATEVTELVDEWIKKFNAVPPTDPVKAFTTVGDMVDYVNLPWADPQNRVWTELTPVVGQMLKNNRRSARPTSADSNEARLEGHAVMVVGRLTTDMMATENVGILRAVTELVDAARQDPNKPEGLDIGLSGSAMIGGDMQASVAESLKSTETTTVILVFLCLIVIYRSPLLVIIPMATIAISLSVASDVVALLAEYFAPGNITLFGITSDFKIFTTTKIFVIVILFGAGTDFCLFLISRFKEELGLGTDINKASGTALSNVGDALAASAFTTILGLATMFFAEYGKFVYSGPVVAICLFVALLACISFAPSLLRAFGKVVFWPFGIHNEDHEAREGESFDDQMRRMSPLWNWVAVQVLKRPGWILWGALGIAAVFILEGLDVQVTHDFMNELAEDRASKQGTELIREYFPPGESAPMSVVAYLPEGQLNEKGNYSIAYLNMYLYNVEGVADVRSLYKPRGGDPTSSENLTALAVAGSPLAKSTFVSETGEYAGRVTQLHLVLDKDPFSRDARKIVDVLEEKLGAISRGEQLPEQAPEWFASGNDAWQKVREGLGAWKGATFEYIGTTPGMRDLQNVTSRDETTIKMWVVGAVFAVIVLILRRPMVCVYLIITVLLSYYGTIGLTEIFFGWFYGDTFDGLDWKAPVFLFVILIAVGQDYNIYLTTRVFEEQEKLGPRRGLRKAMVQTGGIITSCGIIMAGTFIAMTTGTLRGMIELGFSLSLGVLLDTFFVRTVVVPCFFALMSGKEEDPSASENEPQEADATSTPAKSAKQPTAARSKDASITKSAS